MLYMLPFLPKNFPARIKVNITAALDTDGAAPATKVNIHMMNRMQIGSIIFLSFDDLNHEKNITSAP